MIYSLLFLILSILSFSLSYYFVKKLEVNKNEKDCNNMTNWDIKNKKCMVWDDNMCRNGTLQDNDTICVSEGNIWPLVFLSIGVILILCSFVSFYKHV